MTRRELGRERYDREEKEERKLLQQYSFCCWGPAASCTAIHPSPAIQYNIHWWESSMPTIIIIISNVVHGERTGRDIPRKLLLLLLYLGHSRPCVQSRLVGCNLTRTIGTILRSHRWWWQARHLPWQLHINIGGHYLVAVSYRGVRPLKYFDGSEWTFFPWQPRDLIFIV